MNTDTNWTDAKEFTGQAVWAEDSAPLLECVEATYARRLERLVKEQYEALINIAYDREDFPEMASGDVAGELSFGDLRQANSALASFEQLRKEMEADNK